MQPAERNAQVLRSVDFQARLLQVRPLQVQLFQARLLQARLLQACYAAIDISLAQRPFRPLAKTP